MNYRIDIEMKNLRENRIIPDNALGLFKTGYCVLLQIPSSGGYTYKAVNYVSYKAIKMGVSKKPLTPEKIAVYADKMKNLDINCIEIPNEPQELLRYVFTETFPIHGFNVRPQQISLASHMLNSLLNGGISLTEAEVGSGKTMAYLTASILFKEYTKDKRPIVITTSSIQLQREILEKHLPALSDILVSFGVIDNPVTAVIRKGKEHYICDKRLNEYLVYLRKQRGNRDNIQLVKHLTVSLNLRNTNNIDLDTYPDIKGHTKAAVCVGEECGGCSYQAVCRYSVFIRKVMTNYFSIQICNHNYYIADIKKKGLRGLLPGYCAVIADEAHKLPDVVMDMYTMRFYKSFITQLISDLSQQKRYTLREIKALHEINRCFWMALENNPEDSGINLSRNIITYMKQLLERFSNMSKPYYACDTEIKKILPRIHYIIELLYNMLGNINSVCWLSRRANDIVFNVLPQRRSKFHDEIRKDLWGENTPYILTSATLSQQGGFSFIKNNLGLSGVLKVKEASFSSPFNYKENARLYISQNMLFPDHTDNRYISAIANETAELIKAANGHTMVLFTSYKVLSLVYEEIETLNLGYKLIRKDKGNKHAIDEFKSHSGSVLFAAGSCWEGIDIPGDVLSALIIVKLPFDVPDPEMEYEKDLFEDEKEFKNCVLIPRMVIELRQGAGRLIRTEDDTGFVAILDIRAAPGKVYHNAVLEAFRDYTLVHEICQLRKFIRDVKSESYYQIAL